MRFQIQLEIRMFNKTGTCLRIWGEWETHRFDLFTASRGRARDALARGGGITSSSGNGWSPKWKWHRYHPLEVVERAAEHNDLELGAAIAAENRSEFH